MHRAVRHGVTGGGSRTSGSGPSSAVSLLSCGLVSVPSDPRRWKVCVVIGCQFRGAGESEPKKARSPSASFLRRGVRPAASTDPQTHDARRECTEIRPAPKVWGDERTAAKPRRLSTAAQSFWQIPPTAYRQTVAVRLIRVGRELRTVGVRRTSLPIDSFDSRGCVTLRTFRRSCRMLRWNDS